MVRLILILVLFVNIGCSNSNKIPVFSISEIIKKCNELCREKNLHGKECVWNTETGEIIRAICE